MKISQVTDGAIFFDNGNYITFAHSQDCCEDNYADFLSTVVPANIYYDHDFGENLEFKKVDGMGFIFGDKEAKIFVPCYSVQNGYYSEDIEIYYNKRVLYFDAEYVNELDGGFTEYPVNYLPVIED